MILLPADARVRNDLVARIRCALENAITDSHTTLRGSLTTGHADPYSDIDVAWLMPIDTVPEEPLDLRAILHSAQPVASLRLDLEQRETPARQLAFIRFASVPLFWRLDLEILVQADPHGCGGGPILRLANTDEWSLAESALMNGVAALTAHLRGDDALAAELSERGLARVGTDAAGDDLAMLIGRLCAAAKLAESRIRPLALEVEQLAESVLHPVH